MFIGDVDAARRRDRRPPRRGAAVRSLRAADVDAQATTVALDGDQPRAAAHRAVLDELTGRVGIDVEVDVLATVRAAHFDLPPEPAPVADPDTPKRDVAMVNSIAPPWTACG